MDASQGQFRIVEQVDIVSFPMDLKSQYHRELKELYSREYWLVPSAHCGIQNLR